MTIVVAIFSAVLLVATVSMYERSVALLRTELNYSRANEQLLLSRLQARSLSEYAHAANPTADATPVPDKTYLFDPTGLIVSEADMDAE